MWTEFSVPINLSNKEHLNMPAELLSTTIVPAGKVFFAITFPFTRPMMKIVDRDVPWTVQDILTTFDVLYTMAYEAEDRDRVHEVIMPCTTCSTELNEEDFSFSRLDEGSCRICLSARMSTKLILPCGHDFHVRCIRDWFKEQNSCPLCKQPVVPCAECNSKRSIEFGLTDNQLRQLTGEPRIPTQGPFGIGAFHYEQLYFSALFGSPSSEGMPSLVKLRVCAELSG